MLIGLICFLLFLGALGFAIYKLCKALNSQMSRVVPGTFWYDDVGNPFRKKLVLILGVDKDMNGSKYVKFMYGRRWVPGEEEIEKEMEELKARRGDCHFHNVVPLHAFLEKFEPVDGNIVQA